MQFDLVSSALQILIIVLGHLAYASDFPHNHEIFKERQLYFLFFNPLFNISVSCLIPRTTVCSSVSSRAERVAVLVLLTLGQRPLFTECVDGRFLSVTYVRLKRLFYSVRFYSEWLLDSVMVFCICGDDGTAFIRHLSNGSLRGS